ncbi:MAG: hypothetical protein IJZ80_10905 [Clostridia bacterium]|nr:hypothetical protein [Clostridia bacterium]
MKKVLISLLTLCLIICISMLAACENKNPADTESQTDANTTQAPSEETTEPPVSETIAPAEVETDPDGGLWSPAVQ